MVFRYAKSTGAGKSVDSRECMCSSSCSFRQAASKGMSAVANEEQSSRRCCRVITLEQDWHEVGWDPVK